MNGGGEDGSAGNGDESEDARRRASRHFDQYEQSYIYNDMSLPLVSAKVLNFPQPLQV